MLSPRRPGNALRKELLNLEQGGIWTQFGITNFLEGDLFAWYLDAWNDGLAETVRALVGKLDEYDPTTLSVEPAQSRDLLKKLYHRLFPPNAAPFLRQVNALDVVRQPVRRQHKRLFYCFCLFRKDKPVYQKFI